MTRVVGGVAGGRRLAVPSGSGTRPTSDRTREGLFSTLEAIRGGLGGGRVLDLYAGSGAVGLEAVSRGAAVALIVESDRRAAAVIRTNIASLGLRGAQLRTTRVERLAGGAPPDGPYDIVFADPPYAVSDQEIAGQLDALHTAGWFAPGAVVVVERPGRSTPFPWPPGIVADRWRRYGETMLWYGRAAADPAAR